MARPTRNNADYFTHSANLRNDRRVKAIRTQFGAAGYGLLIMLIETLTDADFTQLDTADLELELLAGDLGVSVTEIHSLLQLAEKIGFFARNEAGLLICPDLNVDCHKTPVVRLHNSNFEWWKQMRAFVLERDNYTCTYCGQVGGILEVDHIQPLSKGGTDDYNNLTTACRSCNRKKGSKLLVNLSKSHQN